MNSKNTLQLLLLSMAILLLNACGKKACDDKADVSEITAEVKIKRVEEQLFKIKSRDEAIAFMNNNALFADKFLRRKGYPNDTILGGMLFRLAADHRMDTLVADCEKSFANTDTITREFSDAFKHIKYYYKDFKQPEVDFVITGMGQDLVVSDSLVVVGIDFFLGRSSKYRPMLPEYVLHKYRKPFIVPLIVREVSRKYNEFDVLDNTLLAEMIWHGKALYFTKQMMPCVNDSILLGYTPRQMADLDKHQGDVWNHFVSNKLLFERSHATVNKYVSERPYTAEIGPKCPGMIGAWLGYEIIKRYMQENPSVTLQALMKDKDAKAIFTKSKYKPEK